MNELKAGDRFRWKTTRVVLQALLIAGDNVDAVVVAAESEWGRDMIGKREGHTLASIAMGADILPHVASESPPADPLAGVDWSRYLPKEPVPIADNDFRVGDVWAEKTHRIHEGSVFRITGVDEEGWDGWVRRDPLTPTASSIRFHRKSFIGQRSRLIARDGKLVAQSEKEKRAEPVAKLLEEKKVELPRAHDFTNPYLVRMIGQEKERLCVTCGLGAAAIHCEPNPDWRRVHEIQLSSKTLNEQSMRRLLVAIAPKPFPVPYRNDDAGIGAVLGGYLNVAPERGR